MANEQISMIDILIETHVGLERQGPGSQEMTTKALSFIDDLDKIKRVADLGCGSGGQTIILAQNIAGKIVGVDMLPELINIFNDNVKKQNLGERLNGIVASIDDLSFQREEFDLIWSEGAIDNIGFEKGLTHWNRFIKRNGYVVVSCPSWLTDEHPAEVEKFWSEAGCGLNSIGHNIGVMQKAGYALIAAFALPEKCWTDNYFSPRQAAEKALSDKHVGNKIVVDYIESSKYEIELYSKYKQYYGYVFYIGKKL